MPFYSGGTGTIWPYVTQTASTTSGTIYWYDSTVTSSTTTAYHSPIMYSTASQPLRSNRLHAAVSSYDSEAAVVRRHTQSAKERARDLLMRNLTREQQETFEQNGWFVVEGGKSRRKYRINALEHLIANVDLLAENGKVNIRLCAHARKDLVPLCDQLLVQKVMLELDEERFIRIANRHVPLAA